MPSLGNIFHLARTFNRLLREATGTNVPGEKIYKSPISCPARALWHKLHAPFNSPQSLEELEETIKKASEKLSADEKKQVAHHEMVNILDAAVNSITDSIRMQVHDFIVRESVPVAMQSLPDALGVAKQCLLEAWQPLKILSGKLRHEVASSGLDTGSLKPFWYADEFQQFEFAANLYEGLKTGIEFADVLLLVIPRLLPEDKKDTRHFLKSASQLHHLLEQFSMLNILFLQDDLSRNLPSLQETLLQDKRLKLDPESLRPYYDTHKINFDENIEALVARRAYGIFKMRQCGGQFSLTDQGCPASYVQVPLKQVPKELIPEDFQANGPNINLIKLFYFHFLYLLKHTINQANVDFDAAIKTHSESVPHPDCIFLD